jgi:transposase
MAQRRPDSPNQVVFFQELLQEKIEYKPHAARFFLYLANELELTYYAPLSMGSPRYARRILTAVILYAMYHGYYAAQKICRFAEDSIGAQWILSGMRMPSYKTVERTIDALLEEVDRLFIQIIGICDGLSLIGWQRMYIDGTKVQANASKHKAMSYEHLTKKIDQQTNNLEALYESMKPYIDEVEQMRDDDLRACIHDQAQLVNRILRQQHEKDLRNQEQQVFNLDFEENDNNRGLDEESLRASSPLLNDVPTESFGQAVNVLNDIAITDDRLHTMEQAKATLEQKWKEANGNKKIPAGKQINFTDADSSIMMTKHHGVQQCYNNLAWVDAKAHIILGTHTGNNASDQLELQPTLTDAQNMCGSLEGMQAGADAGFFSAGNIGFMKDKGIDFYASYPVAKSPFAKDKFMYDPASDTYSCPQGHTLTRQKTKKSGRVGEYSNQEACLSCPLSGQCTKAQDGIRKIERDMENDPLREEAKAKANSGEGKEILRQRKSVPEPVWGNIQVQDSWKQMHGRGMDNASREFKLHCVMHNIRKILKVYLNSRSYQQIVHGQEHTLRSTA